MQGKLGLIAVFAGAAVLGMANVAGALQGELVPHSLFTGGHFAAAALMGDGELLHTVRIYNGATFGPLLWPMGLLSVLVGPLWGLRLVWGLTPAFNAACGFALGRQLGLSSRGMALVGGLLAFAPWVRTTLGNGQIEQAVIGGAALIWAAALWESRHRLWLTPLLVLAVGLAAPNVALAACLGLPFVLLPRRRWGRMAAVLALCATALFAASKYHAMSYDAESVRFFIPRQAPPEFLATELLDRRPSVGWAAENPAALSNAVPRSFVEPVGPRGFDRPVVHAPYLGGVLLLAAGVALVRRRRGALPMALAAGALAVFSMGASYRGLPMPMALVHVLAPMIGLSDTSYRLVLGAVVALGGLAGVALDPLLKRFGWLLPLVVVASWAETLVLPNHSLPLPTEPAYPHPVLAGVGDGEGAILELPLPTLQCNAMVQHHVSSVAVHGRPMLYGATQVEDYPVVAMRLSRFEAAYAGKEICLGELPRLVRELKVGAVVLHHDHFCGLPRSLEACLVELYGEPDGGDGGADYWVLDGERAGR